MGGNRIGGLATSKKLLARNPNYYTEIAKLGGSKGKADGAVKGFAKTGLASYAGKIGGKVSRRGDKKLPLTVKQKIIAEARRERRSYLERQAAESQSSIIARYGKSRGW